MITAKAASASVAAAANTTLMPYLLKPATAADIGDRLKVQLEKRAGLLRITDKLKRDDLQGALEACDNLIAAQNRWLAQALQLKVKPC